MALLNLKLLTDLGITMSEEDAQLLSEHFETTLDERITNEIVAELDDEQLAQLKSLQESSEDDLAAWLKENVPALKEIIEDETAILLGEIAEHGDNL